MSIEQSLMENHQQYLDNLADFSKKQHEKINELMRGHSQTIDEIKPFDQEKVDLQTSKLMQKVNGELDKAMENVNEQMNSIIQSSS